MRQFLNIFRRKRTWRNDPQLWRKHVAEIQAELDAERLRGWGWEELTFKANERVTRTS